MQMHFLSIKAQHSTEQSIVYLVPNEHRDDKQSNHCGYEVFEVYVDRYMLLLPRPFSKSAELFHIALHITFLLCNIFTYTC